MRKEESRAFVNFGPLRWGIYHQNVENKRGGGAVKLPIYSFILVLLFSEHDYNGITFYFFAQAFFQRYEKIKARICAGVVKFSGFATFATFAGLVKFSGFARFTPI
ncbi:hypothetical protein POVCU2_0002310 [Plasmodium ovale curtisi]|uniref:Uncharacterized protein n=1 Tax=Plasmodium ovale curtisi TaxID=864141 RepID=A0A1A8VMP5_PLAOA|nr:hypothetical protein POVCU2_0002310 [Plasmodium ovale curtisi]